MALRKFAAAVVFAALVVPCAHAQKSTAVTIGANDGRSYTATLYAPVKAPSAPAVLVLHTFYGFVFGRAETFDHAYAQALAREGFVALVPDYAHAALKERPNQPAVVRDLSTMVAWLSARPEVGSTAIGVVGFSIGAAHGTRLAAINPSVKAVVGYYGLYNFRLRDDFKDRPVLPPSAVDSAGDISAPVLLLHGTADDETRIDQAISMKAALENAGKKVELVTYQGAYHRFDRGRNDRMKSDKTPDGYTYKLDAKARDDAWKRTLTFLREKLK